MNTSPVLNFRAFIEADGEYLTTDSRKVATVFGKQHKTVLEKVRDIFASAPKEFTEQHFRLSEYIDSTGRALPMWLITKDAFALLAMSFTGKKAFLFKVAYIGAFNAMAAYIKNQREGLQYQCMAKELESKHSAQRGSFHGRGLNQRKQEKPVLEAELTALQKLVQRPLLN